MNLCISQFQLRPQAVQNLQMHHPWDWQGGQMPRCSWGGGGVVDGLGAAGTDWNWLMH